MVFYNTLDWGGFLNKPFNFIVCSEWERRGATKAARYMDFSEPMRISSKIWKNKEFWKIWRFFPFFKKYQENFQKKEILRKKRRFFSSRLHVIFSFESINKRPLCYPFYQFNSPSLVRAKEKLSTLRISYLKWAIGIGVIRNTSAEQFKIF